MKILITVAAASLLFAGQAVANPEFDNHATYGTALNDTEASRGGGYTPTGDLVSVADSSDNYGSVLFDLDQPSERALSSQPGIGDGADDFGNILYDHGAVY